MLSRVFSIFFSLFLRNQAVEFQFVVIQSSVSPISPTNTFHGRICQGGRQQGSSKPRSSSRGSCNLCDSNGNVRLKPCSVCSHVRAICLLFEGFHTFALVSRIERCIQTAIRRHSGEYEEEGMTDECCRWFRKAKRLLYDLFKYCWGCVVGDGKTSSNTDYELNQWMNAFKCMFIDEWDRALLAN